jgi:hypothetical protein
MPIPFRVKRKQAREGTKGEKKTVSVSAGKKGCIAAFLLLGDKKEKMTALYSTRPC